MTVLTISRNALRRFLRDRSNYFFVFVLPLAIILLIGAQFGGGFAPTIGVAVEDDDPLAIDITEVITAIPGYRVEEFTDAEALASAVSRGRVSAGVVVPGGLTSSIAAEMTPEIGFVSRPDALGPAIRAAVEGAVTDALGPAAAAAQVASIQGIEFAAAQDAVAGVAPDVGGVEVVTRSAGESLFGPSLGQFDIGASSQLVLFMFLTALTGSAALIQSRQLGVTTRMLSTPASPGTIITGEALGRLGIAVFQGVYIALVTLVAFRVEWGDVLGTVAVLLAFGLVGAGAAMLFGAIFTNDQQAGGVAVVAGLGLAALGGCMVPIEVFSPTMQSVAKITPHAWANQAFAELVRRDGTIVDILPELAVLFTAGVALLVVASWRLRRVITRP